MFPNFFWGGMWFGWFFWIVIIVLVIWVLVRGSNRNHLNNSNSQVKETPLDIIKRRYALGEINKEEFEKMRKDLES
jgi:putative membrane protein